MTSQEENQAVLNLKSELDLRSALNFATSNCMDEYDPPMKKSRQSRDPMSHRIIEKRRRDRMNNCLADLSQLIPQHYLKQGQGRIEKTEIIEMAITHIKHIKQLYLNSVQTIEASQREITERFWLGYKEAKDEVMRFLVESQNYSPTHKLCVELQKHLQKQSQQYKPDESSEKKPSTQTPISMGSQSSSGISSLGSSDSSSTDSSNQSKSLIENLDRLPKGLIATKHNNLMLGSGVTMYTDVESVCSSTSGSLASVPNSDYCLTGLSSSQQQCAPKENIEKRDSRDSDTSSKQGSGYKFKNYIKLRFTNDASSKNEQDTPPNDNVSISSNEELDTVESKKKVAHVNSSGSESTSSPYPASEYSSNSGNGSNEMSSNRGSTSPEPTKSSSRRRSKQAALSCSPGEEGSLDGASNVPGFALHPNGTYYIPIVINTEHLLPYLQQCDRVPNAMNIFHPISINVNFGGGQFVPYQVLGQIESSTSRMTPRGMAGSRSSDSRSQVGWKHKKSGSE